MREKVLNLLKNIHEAKEVIEINDLLGLKTSDELRELQETLNQLVEEYIVFYTKKGKYILLDNCPGLKIGRLSVNKKGFGFVILDKEDDIYVDARNMNNAIHDDVVLVEVFPFGVRKEAKVIKILKRELQNLVGEVKFDDKGRAFVKLDDDKKDITIELTEDSIKDCVEGHKVFVKVVKEINKHKYIGEVVKIIGHINDPGTDILSIAYKHGIYEDFGEEVENELVDIPNEVSEKELVGRRDLTNEVIFTIDGDDTKDIDDAISIKKLDNGNYELGVHIADVSNYVKENTALGDAAYERGTSSYLADTVIPMLPHKLSNGICSLNEDVVRLTMSCVMEIDNKGKIVDYDIFPSYIKSRKKMTYKKVNDIILRDIVALGYEPFVEDLKLMNELHKILRKEKNGRGYINFDLDEAKVVQDENGKAIDIVKRIREEGEMLIEDFMIAANETVASHIYNMDLPFIYRVHDLPKPEKIDEFMTLVKILGYKLNGNIHELTPKAMQNILDQLKDKKEFEILSSLLLRSMRKAEYSKENIGHFGLASRAYTHFTSPIRRFPDLVVHRLLKKYLIENDMSMTTIQTLENNLVDIAQHSSEREVASVDAERDVLDMKMAEYMEDHIGEEYDGIITTITNFGFFVELPNLVEGLVHVQTLKGDYFTYVPELLAMIGKSTKKTYRLGDKVKVKCVAASKETSMVDFELVKVDDNNGNTEQES
ncbi:MAG TPA: ribonuclease R [Candidatus Coprovivens excrementavium]|nr:ribonuclease R [Candidatus Coprovivens excrementavium]